MKNKRDDVIALGNGSIGAAAKLFSDSKANDALTTINSFLDAVNAQPEVDRNDPEIRELLKNALTIYLQCHGAQMKAATDRFINEANAIEVEKERGPQNEYEPITTDHNTRLKSFIATLKDDIEAFYNRISKLNNLASDIDGLTAQYAIYYNHFHQDRSAIKQSLRNIRKELEPILTRNPEHLIEHLSIAARYLFRALDLSLSGILWAMDELRLSALVSSGLNQGFEHTDAIGNRSRVGSMIDSYTPGARLLTGRDHFFNRPQTKIESGILLDQAMRQFHEALDLIESPKYPFER